MANQTDTEWAARAVIRMWVNALRGIASNFERLAEWEARR